MVFHSLLHYLLHLLLGTSFRFVKAQVDYSGILQQLCIFREIIWRRILFQPLFKCLRVFVRVRNMILFNGFLAVPDDEAILLSKLFQQFLAATVFVGIIDFLAGFVHSD